VCIFSSLVLDAKLNLTNKIITLELKHEDGCNLPFVCHISFTWCKECNITIRNIVAFSSLEPLRGYQGEDIEIQLPGNLTVYDIDWLAVWCVQYRHNFGHVLIPKDLDVPPAMGQTKITVSMSDILSSACWLRVSFDPTHPAYP
jgi:hypothetical protein